MNDARATDPTTSHAAADDNRPHRPTQRTRALRLLVDAGPAGMTDFELADAMSAELGVEIGQTSAGKRRHELGELGLVRPRLGADRGGTVTRPAPSGSDAIVWEATTAGKEWHGTGAAVPPPPRTQPADRRLLRMGTDYRALDVWPGLLDELGEDFVGEVRLVLEVRRR